MKDSILRYPILEIQLDKIRSNAKAIVDRCMGHGIFTTGVIKGCNAYTEVAEQFIAGGCISVGSSRISQLEAIKAAKSEVETMLLRLPMISEIDDVIRFASTSLNSDWHILNRINSRCGELEMRHKVILMFDLGDLREGIWQETEFLTLAEWVEKELPNVDLYGIGTNLGCYGGIIPSVDNMKRLEEMAYKVESVIGRSLDIISGGATTSLPLVLSNQMPSKINHLRIGEGILLGRDLKEFFHMDMPYLENDTFVLKAEIIEIQNKPSVPVGESFVDAFGNKPNFTDKGIQKRALLAIGKQDFGDHSKLIPLQGDIEVIGSSSDHLIVDLSQSQNLYSVGDHLSFLLYYQSLLYLSLSRDVYKVFND